MKESPIEQAVGSKLPHLKSLPYFTHAMNLLTAIPTLLIFSLLFLGLSLLSTHRDVDMSTYLDRVEKYNEEQLSARLS